MVRGITLITIIWKKSIHLIVSTNIEKWEMHPSLYVHPCYNASHHLEPIEVQLVCVPSTTVTPELGCQVATAQNELVKPGMSVAWLHIVLVTKL